MTKEERAIYNKELYQKNKEKVLARQKYYYHVNKEKKAEYYESNKEKLAEYHKEYYQKNKEKIAEYYESNRDRILEYTKEWRQSPAGKLSLKNSCHKRRAKMKQTDITTDWLIQFEEKSKVCTICGVVMNNNKKDNPTKKHLDHIIPINVGGTHTMDNVRYICRTCNLARPKDGRDYKLVA